MFYSHKRTDGWKQVFHASPIHVIGMGDEPTEISFSLNPNSLPVGMVAELEGSAVETLTGL